MTIDKAIEILVDSGEYAYYGTYTSDFTRDKRRYHKLRWIGHQDSWGLSTDKDLFTLARCF